MGIECRCPLDGSSAGSYSNARTSEGERPEVRARTEPCLGRTTKLVMRRWQRDL